MTAGGVKIHKGHFFLDLLLTFLLVFFVIASVKVKKGGGSMTDSQKLLELAE